MNMFAKIALGIFAALVLLGLFSEDFQQGYSEGYKQNSQGYGPTNQQQCPPGMLPATGPGGQPGGCAPIPGGGSGYSNAPGGAYTNNPGQQPGPGGQWGPNSGGGQYNPNQGYPNNGGGQYNPNQGHPNNGGGQYNQNQGYPNNGGGQYGPNGNTVPSGEMDLGETTEPDGW